MVQACPFWIDNATLPFSFSLPLSPFLLLAIDDIVKLFITTIPYLSHDSLSLDLFEQTFFW